MKETGEASFCVSKPGGASPPCEAPRRKGGKDLIRHDRQAGGFLLPLLLVLLPVVLAWAPRAHAWGSLVPAKTHQYILTAAYRSLAADPTFDPRTFPSLEEIQDHEGVVWARYRWTGEGYIGLGADYGVLTGPGPDSQGASRFAEHYYNPRLKQGGAPGAVSRHYGYLAEGRVSGKKEALPKAAAWGAHFLADMFCVYHVIGTDRSTLQALYDDQNARHKGQIVLGNEIKGSAKLAYLAPVKSLSDNFHTEVTRYLTRSSEDWFDPWYYNGDTETLMSETSSHIAWETTVNPAGSGLPGYDRAWTNAPQTFAQPWTAQQEAVRRFTIASATETADRIDSYFDNPAPAVNNAIQAVATLWRASLSALRPSVEAVQRGETIEVTGRVGNSGSAAFTGAEARLSASGCAVAGGDTRPLGTLPPGGGATALSWKVKPEGPSCRLTLEVIGASTLPDLQYARTETTVAATAAVKKAPAPAADSPVGAETIAASLDLYGKPRFLNPKVKVTGPLHLDFATTGTMHCPGTAVTWKGNAFSAACTFQTRNTLPTPPYASGSWYPGQYAISITGTVDEGLRGIGNLRVSSSWRVPDPNPDAAKSSCWDLAEPVNRVDLSYQARDLPLIENREGDASGYTHGKIEYVYYAYELKGKALLERLTGLKYARRYCLHPGLTFDATEPDGLGKDFGTLRIVLRKRK